MEVNNTMKQSGKITLIGFIIIVIVLYGAFAIFKIITSNVVQGQINNKVRDTMGIIRGAGFTPEKGEEAIKNILQERDDIIVKEEHVISVELDNRRGEIIYTFEYELETNYLLFTSKKRVEVKDHMRSYD